MQSERYILDTPYLPLWISNTALRRMVFILPLPSSLSQLKTTHPKHKNILQSTDSIFYYSGHFIWKHSPTIIFARKQCKLHWFLHLCSYRPLPQHHMLSLFILLHLFWWSLPIITTMATQNLKPPALPLSKEFFFSVCYFTMNMCRGCQSTSTVFQVYSPIISPSYNFCALFTPLLLCKSL